VTPQVRRRATLVGSRILQARTRVHWVMDDAVRDRLVDNFVRQLLNSVRKPVRQREFEYWRKRR
jgi:hypothetical protein